MVTKDFKEFSNEDVIGIIESFKGEQSECDLGELKNLLAEVTNRKLGTQYADTISSLIHEKIAVEPKTKEEVKIKQEAFGKEVEKFPVLKFVSGLFKVIAWVALAVCTALGVGVSYLYFLEQALLAAAVIFAGIAVGTVWLLVFYVAAEKILIKIEIEKHLRGIYQDMETLKTKQPSQ
ncbi:MAG: hypothetical protein M0R40_07440 [Firmicutes bacterium]|nr:hypothetical protein [Bacillota bacterium]